MDVHAPHQPIHGWKDFTVHLVTITIGLLIAVGIEGLVELHREHTLVKEARATMREEIEYNVAQMKDAGAAVQKQRTMIADDIATLQKILDDPRDPAAKNTNLNATFQLLTLRGTAWKTAQGSQALSYMPYEEAQRVADVYMLQDGFESAEERIMDDETRFMGFVAQTHFGHGVTTPAQAAQALEVLGEWQAHLDYLDLDVRVCLVTDQAFLDGKEGPHSMNEDLSGSGGK